MATTLHIYKTATSGGTDGTQISEDGAGTTPVVCSAVAGGSPGTAIHLWLRTAATGKTDGNVVITPTAGSPDTHLKWYLAPDTTPVTPGGVEGTYGAAGAALTLVAPVIGHANYGFWAKCDAGSTEIPINDITVTLVVTGTEVPA